jgi:hypothetical protein
MCIRMCERLVSQPTRVQPNKIAISIKATMSDHGISIQLRSGVEPKRVTSAGPVGNIYVPKLTAQHVLCLDQSKDTSA